VSFTGSPVLKGVIYGRPILVACFSWRGGARGVVALLSYPIVHPIVDRPWPLMINRPVARAPEAS